MIKNKKISLLLFSGIFLLLLLCNFLTDLVADDFIYIYSFENGERITGIFQIFGSIKAHSLIMNGRFFAHFFAQLFLLLPKWIFNILNSLIFTGMIYLIYKISSFKKANNLMILGIFSTVWIFSPTFGQVFLWLDGSCNYLWAYFLGAAFILPYVNSFSNNKFIKSTAVKVLFIILSFISGAYSENSSAAFICVAVLLFFVNLVFFKVKPKIYEILGIIFSFAGYITLYLSPAQWSNKSAEFSVHTLLLNFSTALDMYKNFAPVLIFWIVAFVISLYAKSDIKKILLSVSFLAGSLLSNFMMTLASYYDSRSSVSSLIMLIISLFILLSEIFETNYQISVSALISVLLLFAIYYVCIGVKDIYVTHSAVKVNEQTITECIKKEQTDIELPVAVPQTKYSALYGIRYLSTETAETWPNDSMAKYYGVDSIIGIENY